MKRWLRGAVWILAGVALPLALYAATASWPDTPDGLFHLQRVRALAEALRVGVLYPRWFPDFAFGYGYPVLNFYAPAFYYPLPLRDGAPAAAVAHPYVLLGWLTRQ